MGKHYTGWDPGQPVFGTFKTFKPSADPPHSLDRPSPLSSPLWRNEWNAQVTPRFKNIEKSNG
jgi:hypothetical protein